MKKFIEEFKAFISRGSVLDMAIGVIVGGAFGAITGSLVSDVITPLLAVLFKSPNTDALNITLRAATEDADAVVLGLGTFVGTIINFLVIALVLFAVTVLKIFLIDLAGTPALYRIAGCMITGAVLIAGAWLYARFAQKGDPSDETRP